MRNHVVHVSESNLITIAGGKWTTYRVMAQETVDTAVQVSLREAVILLTPIRIQTFCRIQIRAFCQNNSQAFSIFGSGTDFCRIRA